MYLHNLFVAWNNSHTFPFFPQQAGKPLLLTRCRLLGSYTRSVARAGRGSSVSVGAARRVAPRTWHVTGSGADAGTTLSTGTGSPNTSWTRGRGTKTIGGVQKNSDECWWIFIITKRDFGWVLLAGILNYIILDGLENCNLVCFFLMIKFIG